MTTEMDVLKRKAKCIAFFNNLDEQFKSEFLNTVQYLKIDAASTLISQSEQCQHLAILVTGSVRVFKLSNTGKEITLYRIQSGESCVLTASCILSEQKFPAYAKSETACEVLLIPSASVQKWIKTNTHWQKFIFSLTANRLSDVIEIVEEVAFKRMDLRIAKQLLLIASDNNQQIESTHQQLADELGTSREVVSRILKDFEHRGFLKLVRGKIIILNSKDLSKIAEVV